METWAGWNPNGIHAAKKQEICGGENAKPCGICANVADAQGKQWERGGDTRARRAGFTNSGEALSDPDIFNDDNSGHGTSPVFRGRSPEAEIPGSDPNADRQRCQEFIDGITAWARHPDSPSCRNGIGNFWAVEPNVGRVANGIPSRVDRLKCLGGGVVPQIPQLM
jgi:hypothetical protein